jgi:hypothetical protein
MDIKHFAFFLAVLLLAFFGYMAWDWNQTAREIQSKQGPRDYVGSQDGGEGAAVRYVYGFPEPVFSHDFSTPQIEALKLGSGDSADLRYHINGLTQAGYQTDAQFHCGGYKRWFKDEYVMWIDSMTVEFTYNTMTVYVSNAYPEGSCPYEQILAHEKQHVEIHREVYREFQGKIQERMASVTGLPTHSHPITTLHWDEGKESMGKMISDAINPVFEEFEAELARRNGLLDSPENYAELKNRCPDW